MKDLMRKIWSQYEAERATGNADAAEMIGDVYTSLDIIEMGGDVEENRDYMESLYYGLGHLVLQREGLMKMQESPLWEILKGYEEALVKVGILEPDEPEDEPEETSTVHWDEWMLDNAIDRERDALALVAYER